MKVSMKKSVKTFLAIMFSAILALGTFSVAIAAGLNVDEAGGNVDEIIFGAQTKEDGYIGTAMPDSIESSSEEDYYIETAEEFDNFYAISKANNFAGITVHLAANISVDADFDGIGSVEVPFAGTFNGHGYAITKMNSANGLFVAVNGATIQKLVIGSAKSNTGILAGTANNVTVEKVVISRSKVTAETNVGGMFGSVEGNSSISDSTVRRLVINTTGEAAGFAVSGATMNNCVVVNSYLKGAFVNGN